jgi:hypothetical protein
MGQPLGPIQQRCTYLVQSAEGQLHLRLDTRPAEHPTTGRLADQVVEQRSLADPRLADHDQRPALTRANSPNEPVQLSALPAPTDSHSLAATLGAGGNLLF